MESLSVTVVGQDIFEVGKEKFQLAGINTVNELKTGHLGNLKTLTYQFELPENEVIEKRKILLSEMAKDEMRLMPMYLHGDWMRIFVFKPFRI